MRLARALWALAAMLVIGATAIARAPAPEAPARRTSATGAPMATRRVARADAQRRSPSPGDAPAPSGAARGFLNSYLAVSYGLAPPPSLRDATLALTASFERNPPHANQAATGWQRVTLRAWRTGPEHARAVGTVSDGRLVYAVTLELERIGGRWLVTRVGPS